MQVSSCVCVCAGKQLHPRIGLLDEILQLYERGELREVAVLPISIDYERPVDVISTSRQHALV